MTISKKFVAGFALVSLLWSPVYTIAAQTEDLTGTRGNLRGEITQGLQNSEVLNELSRLGISKTEVQLRLAAMTDEELLQVQKGQQRQAGGDAVVVVSVTTLLIGIILLILLLR